MRFAVLRHIKRCGTSDTTAEKIEEKSLTNSDTHSTIYIDTIQTRFDDLLRAFLDKRTKEVMDQKVDALVHAIHILHRHAYPDSESLKTRVQSLHFTQLIFQPKHRNRTPVTPV